MHNGSLQQRLRQARPNAPAQRRACLLPWRQWLRPRPGIGRADGGARSISAAAAATVGRDVPLSLWGVLLVSVARPVPCCTAGVACSAAAPASRIPSAAAAAGAARLPGQRCRHVPVVPLHDVRHLGLRVFKAGAALLCKTLLLLLLLRLCKLPAAGGDRLVYRIPWLPPAPQRLSGGLPARTTSRFPAAANQPAASAAVVTFVPGAAVPWLAAGLPLPCNITASRPQDVVGQLLLPLPHPPQQGAGAAQGLLGGDAEIVVVCPPACPIVCPAAWVPAVDPGPTRHRLRRQSYTLQSWD